MKRLDCLTHEKKNLTINSLFERKFPPFDLLLEKYLNAPRMDVFDSGCSVDRRNSGMSHMHGEISSGRRIWAAHVLEPIVVPHRRLTVLSGGR